MTDRTCSVYGCERPAGTKGLCGAHYMRLKRHGDVQADVPIVDRSPLGIDRFRERVDKRGSGDCWEWTGKRTRLGYGRFIIEGRELWAHRFSLEMAVGPPPGPRSVACHHCDNPPCCNPAHLYWGTQADNIADMVKRGRASGGTAKRDLCRNGHPFPPRKPGAPGRLCLVCQAKAKAKARAARRDRYRLLRANGVPAADAQRLCARSIPTLIASGDLPTIAPAVPFQGDH